MAVWPPGWLITSSPGENPAGHVNPALPGGPCGPWGPTGPVATLIVTVLVSVGADVAVATKNPALPASANAAAIASSGRRVVMAHPEPFPQRLEPLLALAFHPFPHGPQR